MVGRFAADIYVMSARVFLVEEYLERSFHHNYYEDHFLLVSGSIYFIIEMSTCDLGFIILIKLLRNPLVGIQRGDADLS